MYRYICPSCGAYQDPGECCECGRASRHLNVYQRTSRNYIEEEMEEEHGRKADHNERFNL